MITSGLKQYSKLYTTTHSSLVHLHYHTIIIFKYTLPELPVYGTIAYPSNFNLSLSNSLW